MFLSLITQNWWVPHRGSLLAMFWSFVSITQFSNFLVMSEQNWKLLFGIFELWKLSYNGILVNTRIFGTHDQREVMSLFFFFFSALLFLSFLLHRLTQQLLFLFSFFLLLSFSFFLSSSQTHSNGHFFSSSSFFFFLFFFTKTHG